MDDNRRRQNDAPHYSSQRYGSDQGGRGRGYSGSSADQYRATAPLTSSTAAGRGLSAGSTSYNYYPEAQSFPSTIPSNAMQYQSEYAPDQRQSQTYGGYNPSLMYNVNQQSSQTAVYDGTQQFQSRQPAPMQILSDVAAPYYSGEAGSTSNSSLLQHQASSGSSAAYQPAVTGFTGNINMSGMGGPSLDPGPSSTLPSAPMDQDGVVAGGLDEAYAVYQDALRQIFLHIQESKLAEAATSVLDVSDWLLSNVIRLGLTGDDESLHSDRIKLWNEFNNAWLALLQRQKELTQDFVHTGLAPRHPQSMIPQDFLWKMSKELVRLADGVEKHGLVDYQLGVWEESIIAILLECLDLLENPDDDDEQSQNVGSSRPTAA